MTTIRQASESYIANETARKRNSGRQAFHAVEAFVEFFGDVDVDLIDRRVMVDYLARMRQLELSAGLIRQRMRHLWEIVTAAGGADRIGTRLSVPDKLGTFVVPADWLVESSPPALEPAPESGKPRVARPRPPLEAVARLQGVTSETPLTEVLDSHFIPHRLQEDRPGSSQRYRAAIGWLRTFLRRPPAVSDLHSENIDATIAMYRAGQRSEGTIETFRAATYAMWRFLGDHGAVSNAPGRERGYFAPAVRKLRKRDPNYWSKPRRFLRLNKAPKPFIEPRLNPEPVPEVTDPEAPLEVFARYYIYRKLRGKAESSARKITAAVRYLSDIVKRPALVSDLTNQNIEDVMWAISQRPSGNSVATVNAIRGKLVALANFAWKEGLRKKAPDVDKMVQKRRIPTAWTQEQVEALFATVQNQRGRIGGVQAALWWQGLLLAIWNSAERVTAVLCLRHEHVNWKSGLVTVPAEQRKGQAEDKVFQLHPETLAVLTRIRNDQRPQRKHIFHWPYSKLYIWPCFKRILSQAGLPYTRRDMFHKIRRSVASHFARQGGDPVALLGHSDPSVTKVYLAPEIVGGKHPSQLVFQPGSVKAG